MTPTRTLLCATLLASAACNSGTLSDAPAGADATSAITGDGAPGADRAAPSEAGTTHDAAVAPDVPAAIVDATPTVDVLLPDAAQVPDATVPDAAPWPPPPDGGAFPSLAPNTWHRVRPQWQYPGQNVGHYQTRGWGTLRYNPKNHTILFYEGFGDTPHGSYCIYGNALYELSPALATARLLALSNWHCQNGPPTPLPENTATPTPKDRHTYSQFEYVPATDSLYLAAGASGSGVHEYDFWAYSFATSKWRLLPTPPQKAQPYDCVCEGNLIHDPDTGELFFFRGADRVFAFDVKNETWRTVTATGTAGTIGGHGDYDPKRKRFFFYGNNWTQNDTGSTDFVFFDVASGAWSASAVAGTWPPAKSYATLEYLPAFDVYLLFGGLKQQDTWVYDPTAQRWSQRSTAVSNATSAGFPNAGVSTLLAYDEADDLLIRLDGEDFWVMRYRP